MSHPCNNCEKTAEYVGYFANVEYPHSTIHYLLTAVCPFVATTEDTQSWRRTFCQECLIKKLVCYAQDCAGKLLFVATRIADCTSDQWNFDHFRFRVYCEQHCPLGAIKNTVYDREIGYVHFDKTLNTEEPAPPENNKNVLQASSQDLSASLFPLISELATTISMPYRHHKHIQEAIYAVCRQPDTEIGFNSADYRKRVVVKLFKKPHRFQIMFGASDELTNIITKLATLFNITSPFICITFRCENALITGVVRQHTSK